MDHHRLDLDVAREGEQQRGLRLHLATGPLVGRTALHVADEAGTGERDVLGKAAEMPLEQRGRHIQAEGVAGSVHGVIQEEQRRVSPETVGAEPIDEVAADRALVSGEPAPDQDGHLGVFEPEERHADLKPVVAEQIGGDDADGPASVNWDIGAETRADGRQEFPGVVARCREQQRAGGRRRRSVPERLLGRRAGRPGRVGVVADADRHPAGPVTGVHRTLCAHGGFERRPKHRRAWNAAFVGTQTLLQESRHGLSENIMLLRVEIMGSAVVVI